MPIPPEPWTRGARIALVALAVVVGAGLTLLHHPWYERSYEAGWILATARGRAIGVDFFDLGLGGVFATPVPGIVTLLTPFAGGEALDVGRVHLATSLIGAAAALLLFGLARPRLGWPVATLAALAVVAGPGFLAACNRVSDLMPGTAALLGSLLIERWSARMSGSRRFAFVLCGFVSGLAVGAAAWVRPLNLVLLPAIVIARLATEATTIERERPSAGTTLLALGAIVVGASTVGFLTSFEELLDWEPIGFPLTGGGPMGLGEVVGWLGSGLAGDAPDRLAQVFGWGMLAALVVQSLRRRGAGELAALGFVILALLPGSTGTGRDLLPALVLGLPALLELSRDAAGRLGRKHVGTALACALASTWIVTRFEPAAGRRQLRIEHESLVEFATRVDARLQPEARVASGLGVHLALFLGRPVLPLTGDLDPEDQDAIEAWIDRRGLDALALYPRLPGDLKLVPYFLRRYGEREPDRVVTIPPGYLVRVRP